MHSSAAFSTFTSLCKHHPHAPQNLDISQTEIVPVKQQPLPLPWQQPFYSPCLWSWLLWGPHVVENHTVFVLLCLACSLGVRSSSFILDVASTRIPLLLGLNKSQDFEAENSKNVPPLLRGKLTENQWVFHSSIGWLRPSVAAAWVPTRSHWGSWSPCWPFDADSWQPWQPGDCQGLGRGLGGCCLKERVSDGEDDKVDPPHPFWGGWWWWSHKDTNVLSPPELQRKRQNCSQCLPGQRSSSTQS